MILRSYQVENWGCFVEPIRIGPLCEGINIIAGPNEAGKSTLTEAIARGLFDKRSVSGTDASSLQPWGRAVGPRIVIEFAHGGVEYRLEKRFLVEPQTRLSRQEGDRYVLLSEADEAEDTVREIFNAHLPGKGMTKPEHWGTAQLLIARQGEIGLDKIGSDAEARLRRTLGTMAEDASGDRIEKRIEVEYQKLYTETGSFIKGKGAPAVVTLSTRRAEVAARAQSLRSDLITIEELRRSLEDLRRNRDRLVERRVALDERLKHFHEQEMAYAKVSSRIRELEAEEDARRSEHDMLDKRIKALLTLKDSRETLIRERELANSKIPLFEQAASETTAHLARAEKMVQQTRKEREKLDHLAQELEDARALDTAVGQERDLDVKFKRIDAATARLGAARKKRAEIVAPDKRELSSIRKAVEARDKTRIRLDSSEIVLVIEAESTLRVGKRTLREGQKDEVRGLREVSLRITDIATISASGPQVADENLPEEYAKQKAVVLEKTRQFGTDDIDRLERLEQLRSEREGDVREIEKEIETLAGDEEPEALRVALGRSRTQREVVLKKHPEWRDRGPVVLELDAQRKAAERDFKRKIDDAEEDLDLARKKERVAAEKLAAGRWSLEDAARALEDIERREKEERLDGLDDTARVKARDGAALAWNAARAEMEVARRELEAFPEDPAKARQRAEKEIDAISASEREAIGKEKVAEGELKEKSRAGAYSALARTEEQLADLETSLSREMERAEGIKLLHETLRAEKETMIGAMLSPLRTRVERNLRRIAGPRHQEIRFGLDGLPATMKPADVSEEISLEALSGGTEEQLFFVTRLALAEFLATVGREVVIFDDPLVSSDLDRVARALPILEEAARTLQVLIFTCHPGAYAGLMTAEQFHIDPIRHAIERLVPPAPRDDLPASPGIQMVRELD